MNTPDEQTESAIFREFEFGRQSLRESLNWIAIQEIPSQLYLTEGNFLSRDIGMAKLFDSGAAALEETAHLKLQSFQLVPRQLG